MEFLTNSSRNLYQECPRKFVYMHEMGIRPNKEASALAFGTAIHKLLEAHFMGAQKDLVLKLLDSLNLSPIDNVKARELFLGYVAKWPLLQTVATEQEFSLPLLNPDSSGASRTFELAGKIDAIIALEDGTHAIVEHKTTSDNIGDPACDYWRRLSIDSQISGYFIGAERLGFRPTKIIYDVIGKPTIKPAKATLPEKRSYKKDGTLYANQRETDETPEEYAQRLRDDIAANPYRYFQRREIARLDEDLVDYMRDMWSVSKLIIESRNEKYWPKRISQCFNYGTCPFFDVCSKIASIEDESLYHKEGQNPELSEVF